MKTYTIAPSGKMPVAALFAHITTTSSWARVPAAVSPVPKLITNSVELARAMLDVGLHGNEKHMLKNIDIRGLGAQRRALPEPATAA